MTLASDGGGLSPERSSLSPFLRFREHFGKKRAERMDDLKDANTDTSSGYDIAIAIVKSLKQCILHRTCTRLGPS